MQVRKNSFWLLVPLLILLVTSINAQITRIGGFEGDLPGFWHKGAEPGGATLEWATDQSRSMGRSLKITKQTTGEAAVWESDNMADIWSPTHTANVDIKLGAFVRTENVNTNPQNDDQRWWISYSFYNQGGNLIGETVLPIDQTAASTGGWVADTNAVGETILPEDSYRTIIKFVGGKDATGTVWADDFMFFGRGGAWAGQNWNQSVGVPQGWYYWLPPNGGHDVQLGNGFENTRLTTEESHSGEYSLKFDLPADRAPHDGFVGTKRVWLDSDMGGGINNASSKALDLSTLAIEPGDVIRVSVWLKGKNLVPDSAAMYPATWAVGFTTLFLKSADNNAGYDVAYDPGDMQFVLPDAAQFDWKQFYVDIAIPENPDIKAFEVRLHVYSRFVGTVYFDDLEVQVIGKATDVAENEIPRTFRVEQNFPNPFNPSTTIKYSLPENSFVTVKIFDMLGKEVRTLVNQDQNAGHHTVIWNADTNYGAKVASGIYIYKVEAGKFNHIRKMILLK